MTESKIQAKIIEGLKKDFNAYVVKVIASSKKGVPDILACVDGLFVAIEVKTPKTRNNVSKLQEKNIKDISRAGGCSFVAADYLEVKQEILFLLKNN